MSASCLHFSVSQRFGQCEMGGDAKTTRKPGLGTHSTTTVATTNTAVDFADVVHME